MVIRLKIINWEGAFSGRVVAGADTMDGDSAPVEHQ